VQEGERMMQGMAALNLEINGIGAGMRALLSGPMYHSAPNAYAVQSTVSGELLVLEPRFDAERTLALIELHQLTHAYLVPTMFVRMLRLPDQVKQRYDLSSMRFVTCTGSPCAPEVKRAMIEWWGLVIHESYASSEAGFITHISPEEALDRPGSVGRAAAGATIRILGDAGADLPPGEPGLIYARQPAYTDFTYAHQPEARQAIDRDGLVSVGDMGYLDQYGYLYISDRKSDMVISGGVNIYPAEIEAVLIGMPGVADCAVFGIPDEEFGEALAAAVQRREGHTLDSAGVRRYLAERIANYKVPKLVAFHDELPREESGKIFKRKLRAPYWEGVNRRI
jgi:long-chain acyl-CoA synthetase